MKYQLLLTLLMLGLFFQSCNEESSVDPQVSSSTFDLQAFDRSGRGSVDLTNANAFLQHGGQTIKLDAKGNQIAFDQDSRESYTLVVMKDGYARYSQDFTYEALKQVSTGKPLEVVLDAAFTVTHQSYGNNNPFTFIIGGSEGEITVDWGDGTSDTYSLEDSDPWLFTEHTYASETEEYFVSVTGALDNITELDCEGMRMRHLNTDALTELVDLSLGYIDETPSKISLPFNTRLENIQMFAKPNLEELELPATNRLRSIDLEGSENLSADAINAIIKNVHANAKANNEMNGFFNLGTKFMDDEDDTMIGPPSPQALELLRELRDVYHWGISPDPL